MQSCGRQGVDLARSIETCFPRCCSTPPPMRFLERPSCKKASNAVPRSPPLKFRGENHDEGERCCVRVDVNGVPPLLCTPACHFVRAVRRPCVPPLFAPPLCFLPRAFLARSVGFGPFCRFLRCWARLSRCCFGEKSEIFADKQQRLTEKCMNPRRGERACGTL